MLMHNKKKTELSSQKNSCSLEIIQWGRNSMPRGSRRPDSLPWFFPDKACHQSIYRTLKWSWELVFSHLNRRELQTNRRINMMLFPAPLSHSFLSFHSFQPNVRVPAYLSGVNPDLTPNVVGARETGKTRGAGGFVIALQGLDWNQGLCAPPREGMGDNKCSIQAVNWFHLCPKSRFPTMNWNN